MIGLDILGAEKGVGTSLERLKRTLTQAEIDRLPGKPGSAERNQAIYAAENKDIWVKNAEDNLRASEIYNDELRRSGGNVKKAKAARSKYLYNNWGRVAAFGSAQSCGAVGDLFAWILLLLCLATAIVIFMIMRRAARTWSRRNRRRPSFVTREKTL